MLLRTTGLVRYDAVKGILAEFHEVHHPSPFLTFVSHDQAALLDGVRLVI